MNMISHAEKVLKSTPKCISQVELLDRVSESTGYSRESVRGTILGYGRLQDTEYFKKQWVYLRNPTRFIRIRYAKSEDVYTVCYDTPQKRRYRARILGELTKVCQTESPKILTLAADTGYCVNDFIQLYPECEIVNIERDIEVLSRYKQISPDNVIHYNEELSDFIMRTQTHFDLMNLDLMGYFSANKVPFFERINELKPTLVSINMQYSKNPRNKGEYVDYIRDKYKNSDDIIKSCISDIFYNYDLVDCFVYNRDISKKCRNMRTFIFRVKE